MLFIHPTDSAHVKQTKRNYLMALFPHQPKGMYEVMEDVKVLANGLATFRMKANINMSRKQRVGILTTQPRRG